MIETTSSFLIDLLADLPEGMDSQAAAHIRAAYDFAQRAHGDQCRKYGASCARHGLNVARIMLKLDVDTNTLIASLLHDVLSPHTGLTENDIAKEFGAEVAGLVAGLRNLYTYAEQDAYQQYQDADRKNLEVIRRALLSIIEGDIRVILIRMADCLQDLRHAHQMDPDDQLAIANEAMHIYGPLANRLGIWQLKWELEDLAFRYLEPEKYQKIAQELAERRAERTAKIEQAATDLRRRIREMRFEAIVTGRPKHIYSIYRKMKRKQVDINHIYDIQALRVILEPANPEDYAKMSIKEKDEEDRRLCYQVLGAVHSLWEPIPREFDDYIASPKPNGYKSLHTAVIDKESGQTLEVQIRTTRMHEEAEKGVAAHWAYKEDDANVSASAQRRIQGLRDLLTTLQESDEPLTSRDLLESDAQAERIYVFTPREDVIELPSGSTPIDFAYHVHTEVGHRCNSARVNGKLVSLDYKLKSGDKVEIITSKRPGPRRDWMNPSLGYTGSPRTRSKIRRWFRQQERDKNIEQGREAVGRELKRLGLTDTYTVKDIATALKYDDIEEFLSKVGFGDIQTSQVSGAIAILRKDLKPDDEDLRPLLSPPQSKPKGLTVLGVSGLHTRMAGCCHPIPPEPIIGYITRGKGVTIHRRDCKQVENITERERLIEVDWGVEQETYPIPIVVKAIRRSGLIDEMNDVLRGQNINVPTTKRTTSDGLMTIYLVAEVTSLEQLNWLLQKFDNMENVISAQRQRWS